MKPIHYSELVRYILQSIDRRWSSIPWYTVFYHEPPERLRRSDNVPTMSYIRTYITPEGNEEWLIRWARSKGYIDDEGELRETVRRNAT